MSNKNENNQPQGDQAWLDEILEAPTPPQEIEADENAVYYAGLTRPEDIELEKILAEDWSGEDTVTKAENEEAPATVEAAEPEPESIEPEPIVPVADEPVPQRKIRPKMKKGYGLLGIPHILATVIWLVIIVAIGVSLGRVLWVCCADLMAFGRDPKEATIQITEEDNIDTISQKLGQAKLVRYPGLFKMFAEITGKDERISVGTFKLDSSLDYNAMINAMVYYGSTRLEVDVLFPEGANCAQIFKILEEHSVCTVAELEEYAANGELSNYWFLEDVPRGDKYCLEGYLSPDTYTFYTDDEPRRVLEKFLNEFESRFTDLMREDFVTMQQRYAEMLTDNGFDEEYVANNPLTLHQVVTLASIVQKETSSDAESYDIASVFYNRLTNPDIMTFGSDATVYYAIGDYFGDIDELTEEHVNTDSPYNTRTNQGFPPGAICNPGVHAMYAALEPNDTDYHYFVYDTETYEHRFASTYDEHLYNVSVVED